jgi:hypothetical protein
LNQLAVKPAWSAVVDVFGRRLMAELGVPEASAHAFVLAINDFAIEEHGKPLAVLEAGRLKVRDEFRESLGHAM